MGIDFLPLFRNKLIAKTESAPKICFEILQDCIFFKIGETLDVKNLAGIRTKPVRRGPCPQGAHSLVGSDG